jgi:WD40 repeat protein
VIGFAGPNELVSAGDDGRVRWWSISPAKELRSTPTGKVFNMAVAADGKVAVVWTRRNEKHSGFEVFSPTGVSTTQVAEKGRDLTCAVLSTDGTLAVSGGEDGVARIWDLAAKDRLGADWPLFNGTLADLALTPDRKSLIAIDINGTVKIGDVAKRSTGEPIKAVTTGVQGLVAAPTGDRFATLSATGEVRVWDLAGKELRAWKLPTMAATAAFTPDGKRLVTGNRDGSAYVLELP